MTRVDFYLLGAGNADAVAAVCRLSEKAVAAGHRLYLHVPDAELAERVDGALWSFRQGGFVAHERYAGTAPDDPQPPVLIGSVAPPATHHGVMVNLGDAVPEWFSSFERVLEVVPDDAAQKSRSRERFRYYRERGYPLYTYEQTAEGGWQQRASG